MKDIRLAKSSSATTLKHKRRFCKVEGCKRIVKSQGVCQRHGAKPRKCKIASCPKQAQGNFDGMCKAHFRASKTTNDMNTCMPTTRVPAVVKQLVPDTTPSGMTYYQPVLVHQDSLEDRLLRNNSVVSNKSGEESSTVDSTSAVTDEDVHALDLWDESFFFTSSNRSEELAADLFGLLVPDAAATVSCEDWSVKASSDSGHVMTTAAAAPPRKDERKVYADRTFSASTIPSCSDYTPTYYANRHYVNAVETRDTSSSGGGPYMDYYNHDYPQAREAV